MMHEQSITELVRDGIKHAIEDNLEFYLKDQGPSFLCAALEKYKCDVCDRALQQMSSDIVETVLSHPDAPKKLEQDRETLEIAVTNHLRGIETKS